MVNTMTLLNEVKKHLKKSGHEYVELDKDLILKSEKFQLRISMHRRELHSRLFHGEFIHEGITGLENSIRMIDLFVENKSVVDSILEIDHSKIKLNKDNAEIVHDQFGKCLVSLGRIKLIFESSLWMMASVRHRHNYSGPIECCSYSKGNSAGTFMARASGSDVFEVFKKIIEETLIVAKSDLDKASRVHSELSTLKFDLFA